MDTDSFDWAHDAFVALNPADPNNAHIDLSASSSKWATFTNMRPTLSTQTSIARHGQITPPEDLSPAEPRCNSVVPQGSMPPAQLLGDLRWPPAHQLQALQESKPPQQTQLRQQTPPDRAPKRRRTVKQAPADQSQAPHNLAQQPGQITAADPQPPKRKRGRPKSLPQPQSIEEYSKGGYQFPLSNARQSHLEKNRAAAHKCRQRRKNYIDDLEARGREASRINKVLKENVTLLREEILELKNEVLRHAGCNFWAFDEYLARCAGDLLGMNGLPLNHRQKHNPTLSLPSKTGRINVKEAQEMRGDSLPSQDTPHSTDGFDDIFGNLDEDMDHDDA